MKRLRFLSIIGVFLALSFSTALAAGGSVMYVGGNLGLVIVNESDVSGDNSAYTDMGTVSWLKSSFDTGLGFGASLGATIAPQVRLEGELRYAQNDLDEITIAVSGVGSGSVKVDGEITSLSLMVNGYYDLMVRSATTPFVMAGFGFSKMDFELEGQSEDDNVLAYQLGVGVSHVLNARVTLDVGYRYFATSDIDLTGTNIEYSSHNFLLGARMDF